MIANLLRTVRVTRNALWLISAQASVIAQLEAELVRRDRELIDCELGYSRIVRDHLYNFLIALDMPERQDQVRADLHSALADLKDQVARLEEQTR